MIFGINYAPEQTGTALNTTGIAEGLALRGWDVRVVTGVPHYPDWRRATAPATEIRNGVHVARRNHYIPHRHTAEHRARYELTWFANALIPAVTGTRPSIILGIVPSVGGAALAAVAASRYGIPFCLLFQDLVGRAAALSGMPGGRRVSRLVDGAEITLARRSRRILVVAESFREYLVARGIDRSKLERIRNPVRLREPTEDRARTRARLGWDTSEFVVIHTGSIGYKQGLETAIEAAARLRDERVRLVLVGEGNRKEALKDFARRAQASNVDFMPLVPVHEYSNVLAAADLALLNQSASIQNTSLPAKLGSYFGAGVPVVAAVAEDDEVANEVRLSGAGIVVPAGEADRLADAILRAKSEPLIRALWSEAGRDFAAQHLSEDRTNLDVENFLVRALAANGLGPVSHS